MHVNLSRNYNNYYNQKIFCIEIKFYHVEMKILYFLNKIIKYVSNYVVLEMYQVI